jgi:hypothetical protein
MICNRGTRRSREIRHSKRFARTLSSAQSQRSGFVILVVLVTIAMLSLSLYTFSEMMLSEYAATRMSIQQSQQLHAAQSGAEVARSVLADRRVASRARFLYDASALPNELGTVEGLEARYVLVHERVDRDAAANGFSLQPGLENESGKLNINSLPLERSRAAEAVARLTALPGIDRMMAEAILDWMDEDDEVRPLGAESSFYTAQGYRPRQGRVRSLSELLLIRGMTRELLYGEDRNANGWLDANENDGGLADPPDNADGRLDRGLSRWLTVIGGESTRGADGNFKINVNSQSLVTLYDQLERRLGADAARFIVAYRLEGSASEDEPEDVDPEQERLRRLDSADKRLREQLGGEGIDNRLPFSGRSVMRGGLDLSRNGAFPIRSVVDLIGSSVIAPGEASEETLESPWDRNPASLVATLPWLESILTTADQPVRIDRINVSGAPRETLLTIPGMTDAQVDRLLYARQRIIDRGTAATQFQSVAWLSSEAGLSFEQLRAVAPYVTSGGDVFRGFALGRLAGARSQSVVEFMIDATAEIPVLRRIQPLRPIPAQP